MPGMQIAIRRTAFTAIPEAKRPLLRRVVRRVLGTPADYRAGTTRWLVWSDPTVDWDDVRRLIAAVEGIAAFPEQGDDATLREWLKDRLPAQSDDPATYTRAWLRFDTDGLTPVEEG